MHRLFFAVAIMVLIACNSSGHKFDTPTYEKAKEDLAEKEKKNPEQFLVVSSTDKKNLLGKTVINGVVRNRASVCSYKDVVVKISFCSKGGEVLEEHEETVDEVISPNNSVKFKSRYRAPKGTDDIKITIIGATVQE